MKKIIFPTILTTTLFILIGSSSINSVSNLLTLDYKKIDANTISSTIRNDGSFDEDYVTFDAGFEWPKGSGKYAIYASGLWLSSKVNDSIRVSRSYYSSDFKPGYIDYATQTPMGKDDPLYRMYKISPDFPNGNADFDAWSVWPVNQGAPWIDNNNNGIYEPPSDNPLMKSSQNLFCSFTDGYPDTSVISRRTPPMKAEIHLYAYAKDNSGCVNNTIYYEWKIINKNVTQWTEMSSAIWSDPDIGFGNDDKSGTDSALNMAFAYNATNNDLVYGSAPPAVGYIIKEATGHYSQKSDFAQRWNCASDCPIDSLQSYRVMHGLRTNGSNWINPQTNKPTMFPYSGDPAASSGWLDDTEGNKFILIGSVFGNVNSLDTIDFNTVTLINKGANNLLSVTAVKSCVNQVISVKQISSEVPEGFRLNQNYPNPFNPKTIINYELKITNLVSIKVYDVLGNEVKTLVNQKQNAGTYSVEFNGEGLPSGVYFYKLETAGFADTKRMILLK